MSTFTLTIATHDDMTPEDIMATLEKTIPNIEIVSLSLAPAPKVTKGMQILDTIIRESQKDDGERLMTRQQIADSVDAVVGMVTVVVRENKTNPHVIRYVERTTAERKAISNAARAARAQAKAEAAARKAMQAMAEAQAIAQAAGITLAIVDTAPVSPEQALDQRVSEIKATKASAPAGVPATVDTAPKAPEAPTTGRKRQTGTRARATA